MGTIKKLSAKEVAALLGIPLVKVQRWVHQGKIPCKFKAAEYFFKHNEIVAWAREHNLSIIEPDRETAKKKKKEKRTSLGNSILRGGIHHHLPGDDIFTVLQNAVERIQFPEDLAVDKGLLLDEIIFRESIASTGIGKGVAIPHLKDVRHLKLEYPLIPVFFLENAVDFDSIDRKPVFVLFFIFTPAPPIHLKMLSRLSYCLHNQDFLSLLKSGVDEQQLLETVETLEERMESH